MAARADARGSGWSLNRRTAGAAIRKAGVRYPARPRPRAAKLQSNHASEQPSRGPTALLLCVIGRIGLLGALAVEGGVNDFAHGFDIL